MDAVERAKHWAVSEGWFLNNEIIDLMVRYAAKECRDRDEMIAEFVAMAAITDAVNRAVRGEPVSDFEQSFPPVQAALDLRARADAKT